MSARRRSVTICRQPRICVSGAVWATDLTNESRYVTVTIWLGLERLGLKPFWFEGWARDFSDFTGAKERAVRDRTGAVSAAAKPPVVLASLQSNPGQSWWIVPLPSQFERTAHGHKWTRIRVPIPGRKNPHPLHPSWFRGFAPSRVIQVNRGQSCRINHPILTCQKHSRQEPALPAFAAHLASPHLVRA